MAGPCGKADSAAADLSLAEALDVAPLAAAPAGAHTVVDITDDQAVRDAISAIGDAHGRIDLLVNNAGIGSIGSVEEGDLAEYQAQNDRASELITEALELAEELESPAGGGNG